jgi:hypothetical protein
MDELSIERTRESFREMSVPLTLIVMTRVARRTVTREELLRLVGKSDWLARVTQKKAA